MTRTKKYGEETVLYSKRIPLSKKKAVEDMVAKYLAKFEKKLPIKKNKV